MEAHAIHMVNCRILDTCEQTTNTEADLHVLGLLPCMAFMCKNDIKPNQLITHETSHITPMGKLLWLMRIICFYLCIENQIVIDDRPNIFGVESMSLKIAFVQKLEKVSRIY